jgi:hypothetical protein
MADKTVPKPSSGPGKHSKPDVPKTDDPDRTQRVPEIQDLIDKFVDPKGA